MASVTRSKKNFPAPPPPTFLNDEPSATFPGATTDLEDTPVRKWEDAISFFGSPDKQFIDDQSGDKMQVAMAKYGNLSRNIRSARILSEDVVNSLRLQDFDADDFAEEFFGDQSIEQISLAIDSLKIDTEGRFRNQTLSIAENIHNYVKALEDLRETGERARVKKYLSDTVSKLINDISNIIATMKEFFDEVEEQALQAANSSALLSRISAYSFLFKFSSEIDNYRKTNQFDEIIRISQKVKQFPYLESISLFAKVLKTIELSLKNISHSIQNSLEQMTLQTFNKSHCKLVMDIPHEGNPILKMLNSIKHRVEDSFSKKSFDYSCQQFEDALPFWSVLCDFYYDYNPIEYSENSAQIDRLHYQMVDFFDKNSRIFLNEIKSKTGDDTFNVELHNAIRRTNTIWNKSTQSTARNQIQRIQQNLLNWYRKHLTNQINTIIKNTESSGLKLTNFLLGFLDIGDLYSNEEYQSIIVDPIYKFYDHIHEIGMMNQENREQSKLVPIIQTLREITEGNLDIIFERCSKETNFCLSKEQMTDLRAVGRTLERMLLDQLIHDLMVDINHYITTFFLSPNIMWSSNDIEIKADGWVVHVFNKCIECKCIWKELYTKCNSEISNNIASCILFCIKNIRKMSAAGSQRALLDVMLLEEGLGKESSNIWDKIESRIEGFCVPPKELINKTTEEFNNFTRTVSKQIKSLNPNK
ncbi:hypothetical protein GPJ56_008396 [Histomonas meleagridis]|uniref:uncharacterized protein n=1 Tax=Histomonas meleagridis TaxID=135588 RepID=UPI00355A104B|nr:hypothetical protein GPJ56_008396 [Histomonas meleagridis]KAH0798931.1 hypothetical protein GO595_008322 [Histomonas meleagridis]